MGGGRKRGRGDPHLLAILGSPLVTALMTAENPSHAMSTLEETESQSLQVALMGCWESVTCKDSRRNPFHSPP